MRRTDAGQATRHDLAALRHKLPEQTVILVVDVGDLFRAELTDFLTPEKLASTFARRTARTRTPTPASAKSRTISSRTLPEAPRWPLRRCGWCFHFVSHNSP